MIMISMQYQETSRTHSLTVAAPCRHKTQYHYTGVRTNTSLAATADEASINDFFSMYYQLDTGDIRQSTYFLSNNTWRIFNVTSAAMHGTPLAAIAPKTTYNDPGYDPSRSHLFYVDNTGTLRELAQAHDWNDWIIGPLGDMALKANVDPMTPLTAGFQTFDSDDYYGDSRCQYHIEAKWLMYWPRGEDFLQEVFWDDQTYEWELGEKFEGLDPHSGIVTMVTRPDDVLVRRLYGIGKDGRLNQWYCADCCVNTTGLWKKGTKRLLWLHHVLLTD